MKDPMRRNANAFLKRLCDPNSWYEKHRRKYYRDDDKTSYGGYLDDYFGNTKSIKDKLSHIEEFINIGIEHGNMSAVADAIINLEGLAEALRRGAHRTYYQCKWYGKYREGWPEEPPSGLEEESGLPYLFAFDDQYEELQEVGNIFWDRGGIDIAELMPDLQKAGKRSGLKEILRKNQHDKRRLRRPKWASWSRVDQMIREVAKAVSDLTGKAHEVDHIYPLQGDDVSGLDVPWNKRVVSRAENRKKRNKIPQED